MSKHDPVAVFFYSYMRNRIIINRNTCLLCRMHSRESCLSNDFPSVKTMLVTSMERNCNSPDQCKYLSLKFPLMPCFPLPYHHPSPVQQSIPTCVLKTIKIQSSSPEEVKQLCFSSQVPWMSVQIVGDDRDSDGEVVAGMFLYDATTHPVPPPPLQVVFLITVLWSNQRRQGRPPCPELSNNFKDAAKPRRIPPSLPRSEVYT